jgi:hypothetical protein
MKIAHLTNKPPIYLELFDAIAYFLGRQKVVVRAVIERGVVPADLVKGVGGWYDKTPSRGEWGTEWWFGFHGGGCMLKHRHTNETIEWNGPDPYSFDPFFFIDHLEWRLAQGHYLPLLRQYIEQEGSLKVFDLIQDLITEGIITRDYRLAEESSHASAA